MFGEGFKRGCRTASVILHQGDKTPQRGRQAFPSAVVVELTGVDELTVSRKRPIHLPVTDAHLGGAVEEIVVGHVHVDALLAHPLIQLGNLVELIPLRVCKPAMMRVLGGGARVSGIRTVVLEAHHARLLEEGLYLVEIVVSPIAAQAGRTAKRHATALACLGIDDIHLITYPTARQEGIAPHLNALGTGIVHKLAVLGNVGFGNVFGVQPRTEAEDYHLVSALGTLVHGSAHHGGVGGSEVQEDGILRGPRRNGELEPAGEESLSFAVIAVKGHLVDAERT